jgi:hypothetical protein
LKAFGGSIHHYPRVRVGKIILSFGIRFSRRGFGWSAAPIVSLLFGLEFLFICFLLQPKVCLGLLKLP